MVLCYEIVCFNMAKNTVFQFLVLCFVLIFWWVFFFSKGPDLVVVFLFFFFLLN